MTWVLSATQMLSSLVSFLSCSYGESFPVSAEAVDSSFCLPIGKAKVFIYLFYLRVMLQKQHFSQLADVVSCYWFWHGPTNDTTLLSTIVNFAISIVVKKVVPIDLLFFLSCLLLFIFIISNNWVFSLLLMLTDRDRRKGCTNYCIFKDGWSCSQGLSSF